MDKMFYEELGARRPKPVKKIDQAKLETFTIWAIDFVLLGAVIAAHFIK